MKYFIAALLLASCAVCAPPAFQTSFSSGNSLVTLEININGNLPDGMVAIEGLAAPSGYAIERPNNAIEAISEELPAPVVMPAASLPAVAASDATVLPAPQPALPALSAIWQQLQHDLAQVAANLPQSNFNMEENFHY